MKEINLANNKGIVLVDDEDYEWLLNYKWRFLKGPNTLYARTIVKENNKWVTKVMHQLIMNEPKKGEIDHIDQNGLNNQKNNLRVVTRSQNRMNVNKYKNGTSKFKGVYWHKRDEKWEAQIRKENNQIYLGRFDCEIDAAKAYNEAAKYFHGKYAKLNEV